MYSGTLINDLIRTVEQAEKRAGTPDPEPPAYWYAVPAIELAQFESMAGAA